MNKEIKNIVETLEDVLRGEPWFGRSVYSLLEEIDPEIVFIKPEGHSHSIADLLYHMITWTSFAQKRLEKEKIQDMDAFEALDWREIDPEFHSWKKGLAKFKSSNTRIINLLKDSDDSLLKEIVDYRSYDFRYMINGLIQHHIYHVGQIAYVKKLIINNA